MYWVKVSKKELERASYSCQPWHLYMGLI